jgi:integrase/recombinase XerD
MAWPSCGMASVLMGYPATGMGYPAIGMAAQAGLWKGSPTGGSPPCWMVCQGVARDGIGTYGISWDISGLQWHPMAYLVMHNPQNVIYCKQKKTEAGNTMAGHMYSSIISTTPSSISPTQAADIERLIAAFLGAVDVGASSRETYRRTLKQFLLWLAEDGRAAVFAAGQFQPEDVIAYKAHLLARGLSPHTANSYLTTVRRFFSWMETKGLYRNVAREVKGARQPRAFGKDVLAKGQLQALLATFDRSTTTGARDYAAVNLMARTAIRTVEVVRANWGDIRQDANGTPVLWVWGKGRSSADENVLLTPEAMEPLQQWKAMARAAGLATDEAAPIFPSLSPRNHGERLTTWTISTTVKRALREIGLDSSRLSAHAIRHTAITMARMGGGSREAAQAMARHAKADTTARYDQYLLKPEERAEAFIQF